MAYTAYEAMRLENLEKYGKNVGPVQPRLFRSGNGMDLRSAALRFLHERCEGLRFSSEKEAEEKRTGVLLGTSLSAGQVPYNMQKDTDRLCLERSLENFIDSGVAEDAYNVYYCYLEMFFGHYGAAKKMVELLSEFESNGSSLLMKHRDHYSHSVYVFALGLAIYETNEAYRKAFCGFYGLEDGCGAACFFLEYWGLSSLFHDIGYPFELPFEQVASYFEVDEKKRGDDIPYLAYCNLEPVTVFSDAEKSRFKKLYGASLDGIEQLLGLDIEAKLGESYGIRADKIADILERKPRKPGDFGYFMDHAYFSAVRLYQELLEAFGAEGIKKEHVDALSAIVLHNSLFKFNVAFYKSGPEKRKAPLKMELHPLAFLLMLCDELQCWDRTAYGRNSRTELHPMAAEFDFSEGAIRANYFFDADEQEKIDSFREKYRAWEEGGEQGSAPRLKAYSDMAEKEQRFTGDIARIVDVSDIPLSVVPGSRQVNRSLKHTYLSGSNFLHLYDFAVALNARYNYQGREAEVDARQLEDEFEKLSLEYQLSNINQAKNFSKYLNAIGCFYTDRPVDFEMIKAFTKKQTDTIAPMEHERWVTEHRSMGWRQGSDYRSSAEREQMRCHSLAMDGKLTKKAIYEHYEQLSAEEKGKDWEPFNSMLKLIKKFDGLRIYKI